MKKKFLLVICALMILSTQAFAYQSFLLISDNEISNVVVKDSTILSVVPVVTLSNEKKSAIITSLRSGNTQFSFNKGKKVVTFDVKVKPDKTIISNVNGVKLIPIDLPVEMNKVKK